MISITYAKEANTRNSDASESYNKGRLMMEAYLARIKADRSTKEKLSAMVDAKTNKITRYI